MKKIGAIIALILFLGVLSYSYASEFRSLYNSVFNIESERIVVSPGDAVVFSFSKQISSIDFNLNSGFTIKTLEGGIWSDIGNTVDQFPPLRGYLVRNFSINDLVITASYAPITTIGASIFQKSLKAGWNLVGVAYKDDVNGNVSVANGLGAALPYSQVLDFTGNGFSSGSFLDKAFTGVTKHYSQEVPLFNVYYSGERSFLKNISNVVSNIGYTINSQASMSGVNLNEGLAYGIFVNNDTLISGSQKLTSAENVPYYTPPKVGVIGDIYFYGTSNGIDLNQYITLTDGDGISSYSLTGTLPTGLNFNNNGMGAISGLSTQTGTYVLSFSVQDKDGTSNVSNFNLIISDTASLLNGHNLLTSYITGNPPVGSLTAANKLAADGIINDNSAFPSNYNLNSFISKIEVAKISANVAGLTPNATCNNIFTDVSATTPNSWACGYTEALVNAGLYSTGSLKFYPESYISKSETLRLALESAGYTGIYTNPSNWQAEVVAFGVAKGVTTSFTDYNSPITKGGAYSMFSDARDSNTGGNLLCQLLGNGNCGTTSTGTQTIASVNNRLLSNQIVSKGQKGIKAMELDINNLGNRYTINSMSFVIGSSSGILTKSNISALHLYLKTSNGPFLLSTTTINSGISGFTTFSGIKLYAITGRIYITYDIVNSMVSEGLIINTKLASINITDSKSNIVYLKSDINKDGLINNYLLSGKQVTVSTATNSGITTGTGTSPIISLISDLSYLSANSVGLSSYTTSNNNLSTFVSSTNNDPILSYNLTGTLPTGLTFNNTTGVLTGNTTQTGTYALSLSATDKDGISLLEPFNLIVGDSPIIGNILDKTHSKGTMLNINLSQYATAAIGDSISGYGLGIWNNNIGGNLSSTSTGKLFTITQYNSIGLNFDMNTGILSGSIIGTGSYSITFYAISTKGFHSYKNFNLNITTPPKMLSIQDIAIVSTPNPNGLPPTSAGGINMKQFVVSTDGDPILGYTLTGSIPSGLIITGSGILTGFTTAIGTYKLGLSATDKDGISKVMNFNLIVGNNPTIQIIPDQIYTSGVPINIDFNKYVQAVTGDPILSYNLRSSTNGFFPSGLNFNKKTGILTGTLSGTGKYNLYFDVTSTNGFWNNSNVFNLLASTGSGTPPVVGVIPNSKHIPFTVGNIQNWEAYNMSYSKYVTSTDGDPILSYTLTGDTLPVGVQFNSQTAVISGNFTGTGTYNIGLIATDKDGNSNPSYFSIYYDPVLYKLMNSSPVVGVMLDQIYLSGAVVNLDLKSNVTTLSGNTILSYGLTGTLPTGLSFSNVTGIISGTVTGSGIYNLGLFAKGIYGTSNIGLFNITVKNQVVAGTQPIVGIIPDQTYLSGSTVNIDLNQYVTFNGGDTLSYYSLPFNLPAGLSFSGATGILSGTPTQTGTYILGFKVYTISGAVNMGGFNLIINTPVVAGTPPTIGTIASQTYLSGATVNFDLSTNVTPTNGDPILSYGLTGTLPTGLSFNTGSAILSGVVTGSGVYNLKLSATDKDGTANAKPLTITVNTSVVVAPSLGTIASQTYLSGATVNLDLSTNVTVNTNPIGTYSLIGVLPTGLSFSGTTGIISGIPTQTGSYNLKFEAIDTTQVVSNRVGFNITVNPPVVVTTPPIIGTIPNYTFLSGATVNSNFNKHVTITDGNPILSYGLTGVLPTGLIFSTGSAIISGTTTQTGTYNMGFNATDIDGISNTSNFNIIVQ